MEHRQNRLSPVQRYLPVRGGHRVLDAFLPRRKVIAPLLLRRLLRKPRTAAAGVRADVRIGVGLLPSRRQLMVHIGALRRRLRPQGLRLEAGGHLAPHHAPQICVPLHLLRRIAVLHRQKYRTVLPPLTGRLLCRVVPALRLLRRAAACRQIRTAEQQHRQDQRCRHGSPHMITSRPSLCTGLSAVCAEIACAAFSAAP